jgi:nucleoid-associated protein YgaU
MAAPIPGTRRPARRSPTDLLIGLLATAALLALTAGVPLALVTVFGLPVPHSLPTVAVLTHQLDVFSILRLLSVAVWLAWLQLVCCVFAEVRAAVRNTGRPARVPLAGGTQALVHRLVTAALLTFAATAALSPAFTQPASPQAAHQALHPARPDPGAPASTAAGRHAASAPALTSPPVLAGPPQLAHSPFGTHTRHDGHVPRENHVPRETHIPHAAHPLRVEKIYVVQPPAGRFHESLWEIAQKFLGDGRRYREIFELNAGQLQPDGTRLTSASLIRPGWVLHMPREARGPGIEVVTAPAEPGTEPTVPSSTGPSSTGPSSTNPASQAPAAQPGAGRHRTAAESAAPRHQTGEDVAPVRQAASPRPVAWEDLVAGRRAAAARHPASESSAARPGAGRHEATAGPGGRPGAPWHRATDQPAASPTAPAGRAVFPVDGRAAASTTRPASALPWYPHELAAAALLSSAVLAALGRRRREQLWQRAFGRKVLGPGPEPALAEAAMRAGADEPSSQLLDAGLRYLSHALARSSRTPPTVFAAHLSLENLDLWVAPADLDPPTPWTAVGDGQVWRLPATALPLIELNEAYDEPQLFPGLVTIGTDGTGRVLADLAAAQGLISVTGPAAMVTAVLSAMALELATNRWSDEMQLTLVGFGPELAGIAPDRVLAVDSLDEALPALEARAAAAAGAMAAAVGTRRRDGPAATDPASWPPHYLISAIPPTLGQRTRLLALAAARHESAAGYVLAGDVPGSAWTWEVTADGRLLAGVLGLDVQAQLLPAREYAAVLELFDAAAQLDGAPLAPPAADAAPPEQLDPDRDMPVDITILGPVSVRAPGVLEPDLVGLVTEVVVFLAVHPGGVHRNAVEAAIWPRGTDSRALDEALAAARDWLGTDGIGRPHLAEDAAGRLRLGSGVRVDWHVFRALAGSAGLAPPGSAAEAGYLAQALDLVRGQLLDGRPPRRYGWLATSDLEYETPAQVADAAHRLAAVRLAGGDSQGAMDAARAGLRLAFDDELLWRDLLRAAQAAGRPDLVRAVVDELCARTALDEVLPQMAPETEALIDEILPSWRSALP